MDISEEKRKRFEQIEEELTTYNDLLAKGMEPPMPQYDFEELMKFRGWQLHRMNQESGDKNGIEPSAKTDQPLPPPAQSVNYFNR